MEPVILTSNRPANRFYRGGSRIAQFRGEDDRGDRVPEDWVASCTTLAGHDNLGLAVLPDGRRLVDAIESDPLSWLGRGHIQRFGIDSKLLVKLLHAGERLPVHVHPDRFFAKSLLGRNHGKAEAWFILSGGEIHLGLKRDVSLIELRQLVDTQDVETLVGLLHRVTVQPGDTIYVPPGVLHSIGEEVFLVELQEPEDLSILLEWRDFELDGRADGHLGLGFEVALGAVDRRGRSADDIAALISADKWGGQLLPDEAEEYFRLERYQVNGSIQVEPGFAVIVLVNGAVECRGQSFQSLNLVSGSTTVVPYLAGQLELLGDGEVLVCRPPLWDGTETVLP